MAKTNVTVSNGISIGAGIAISFIWLAGSATSVMLAMICFVWTTIGKTVFDDLSIFGLAIFVFILAPFLGIWIGTHLIITGREPE